MPKFKQILSESRHESLARLYWLFKATFFSPVDEFSIAASKSFLRLRFSAFKWSFSSKEWTKTKHTHHIQNSRAHEYGKGVFLFEHTKLLATCQCCHCSEASSSLEIREKGLLLTGKIVMIIRALNLATLDGYSARFQSRGDDVDRCWNVTDQCSLWTQHGKRFSLLILLQS